MIDSETRGRETDMITKPISTEDLHEGDVFVIGGQGATIDGQRLERYARYAVKRFTDDGAFIYGADYASLDHRHGVTVRWADLTDVRQIVRK